MISWCGAERKEKKGRSLLGEEGSLFCKVYGSMWALRRDRGVQACLLTYLLGLTCLHSGLRAGRGIA